MVTTLAGVNIFLLKAELDRLVSEFVKTYGDLGLERLDGEDVSYERIMEATQSLPFLASKKMVVLKEGSANKEFTANIEQVLSTVPDSTDLVILEPNLDKRTVYYKALKGKTDFKEFSELDSGGLPNWLVSQAKSWGGSLSLNDARYLVERVGANQQLLNNELDKLLSYSANVNKETINLLTEAAPHSTVFELLDAAFAGNPKRALSLYADQRAQQMEPQYILAMITWQLYILSIVKTAGQRSPDEIAREARLSPFVVRKTQTIASKLALAQVKTLVHDALELDVRLKSETIDADEALQDFLLDISQL